MEMADTDRLSPELLLWSAGRLLGEGRQPREAVGERGNSAVRFTSDDSLAELCDRANSATLKPLSTLSRAAWLSADCILTHALTDGNGRLSRALFQWTLLRDGLIDKPIFPLGPIIHLRRARHAMAVSELSNTGRWSIFIDHLLDCFHQTICLSELN